MRKIKMIVDLLRRGFIAWMLSIVVVGCVASHQLTPLVVDININTEDREQRSEWAKEHAVQIRGLLGCGSGVAIGPTEILTAAHVMVTEMGIRILYGDEEWMVLSTRSIDLDLMVITVDRPGPWPVLLVRDEPLARHEWVTMSGRPKCGQFMITEGFVLGPWLPAEGEWAVDGTVIPGMSGGGVYDWDGKLVAINVATTLPPGRALALIVPLRAHAEELQIPVERRPDAEPVPEPEPEGAGVPSG
jgi:S1-C subfamily serine protease